MKKILEQLSRVRFFTGFKIHAFFSALLRSRKKRAEFSNPVKNRVPEGFSNIFFPLERLFFTSFAIFHYRKCHKLPRLVVLFFINVVYLDNNLHKSYR